MITKKARAPSLTATIKYVEKNATQSNDHGIVIPQNANNSISLLILMEIHTMVAYEHFFTLLGFGYDDVACALAHHITLTLQFSITIWELDNNLTTRRVAFQQLAANWYDLICRSIYWMVGVYNIGNSDTLVRRKFHFK